MGMLNRICSKRWYCAVAGCTAIITVVIYFSLRGGPEQSTRKTEVPVDPPWFQDVTAEVDLVFVHDAGPTGAYFMPQIMGSGAAFLDFDNDGRLDIFLIQNGGPDSGSTNRLYKQMANGQFKDVSKGSGLDVAGYGMGVAVGDVNNDGWVDVVVTEFGATRLFLNQKDGTFREITREAGIDNPLWGTSASFVDFDRDGWLDLVVTNYVDYDPSRVCLGTGTRPDYCHPNQFPGRVTRLYRNLSGEGSGVRFKDVSVESGIGRLASSGLGVICADFDGDGWPDIFVANDARANHLWINQRNGSFKEEAMLRGVAYNAMGQAEAGMGVAVGDIDGDGLFDLFVTHLTEETHTFWRQKPRGHFRDETADVGLTATNWRGTGFGTVMVDLDNDGWLDIAIANGRVSRRARPSEPETGDFWSAYVERNQLFANDGSGRFHDISPLNSGFCGINGVFRGIAWGDFDGDGAPDLLVTSAAGSVRLYRNIAGQRGHWLMLRVYDPALKRDAYGAEVTVRAGKRQWFRHVNPGGSYLCSSDPRVHVGLGTVTQVDEIEVSWPDGKAESFIRTEVDRSIVLEKGSGRPVGSKKNP